MWKTRLLVLLFAVTAMTPSLFAQSETIAIKRHARGGKDPAHPLVLLYGELNGRSVTLQCAPSHDDCKELPNGEYNMERLLEGEGAYPGCPNVDVYRQGADSFQEEPLGEYCLIERKSGVTR